MPRRRLIALCAVVAAAVVVAVVLLVRGGGDEPTFAVKDPLAEALAYAPASSEVVAAVDVQRDSEQGRQVRDLATTFPAARFGADAVRTALRSIGLDPDRDAQALLGGPLVIAGPSAGLTTLARGLAAQSPDLAALLRTGAIGAIVGHDAAAVGATLDRAAENGRLRKVDDAAPGVRTYAITGDAGVVAARGPVVLLARDADRIARAFALHDRGGGLTPAAFARRLGPLKGPALVRVALQPRVLAGAAAAGVPFVDALRSGALSLRLEDAGLRLRAHLATDPDRLGPQDLPLAPGPQAPDPAPGNARFWAGVRGFGQTLRVLTAARGQLKLPFLAGVEDLLGTLDSVKGPLKTFGGIDLDRALLDQLTGTTTFTREPGGWALRAELRDGGPLRSALGRLAAIPDIAISLAGLDMNVDRAGDAFVITRKGEAFARVAVLGNTLVASTDLRVSLRAVAARRPQRAPRPGGGALRLHAAGKAIQDLLIERLGLPGLARLALDGFGDLDGTARASLSGVDFEALLRLAR